MSVQVGAQNILLCQWCYRLPLTDLCRPKPPRRSRQGSDTDFRVCGKGLVAHVEKLKASGVDVGVKSFYPYLIEPDFAGVVFPELGTFVQKVPAHARLTPPRPRFLFLTHLS